MLGVKGHHPAPCGARCGLDADAVFQGPGQQAVRIGVSQVVLGQERQLAQILHALDVLRGEAFFLHFCTVVGHIVPHMAHLSDQALVLPCQDLLPVRGLDFFLIVPFHMFFSFLFVRSVHFR